MTLNCNASYRAGPHISSGLKRFVTFTLFIPRDLRNLMTDGDPTSVIVDSILSIYEGTFSVSRQVAFTSFPISAGLSMMFLSIPNRTAMFLFLRFLKASRTLPACRGNTLLTPLIFELIVGSFLLISRTKSSKISLFFDLFELARVS